MDSLAEKKQKYHLAAGIIAGFLYGAGDILIGYFGQSGTSFFGGAANTDMIDAPMWQFELSLAFGLIAVPLMRMAGSSMYLHIQKRAKKKYPKILKTFSFGMKLMVMFAAAAHSVCCVAMMCIKAALEQGMSVDSIESIYRVPLLLPFIATNIWITVSELSVSISYVYLVLKKVINVPRPLLIFNPICIYLFSYIIRILIQAFTRDAMLGQLFAGGASFGYGLMFLGGYISVRREEA